MATLVTCNGCGEMMEDPDLVLDNGIVRCPTCSSSDLEDEFGDSDISSPEYIEHLRTLGYIVDIADDYHRVIKVYKDE